MGYGAISHDELLRRAVGLGEGLPMIAWKPSLGWAWEYVLPPYRGVLISVRAAWDGCARHFEAHIETPAGDVCAPEFFDDMKAAQAWVEREVRRFTDGSGLEQAR